MAGNFSWEQANRRQKLGLVWIIRKKISQIIKDYFHLPFFHLIILWGTGPNHTDSQSLLFFLVPLSKVINDCRWNLCWNLEQSIGARNRVGIGLAYQSARDIIFKLLRSP
jgi:hypothetical protein